MANSVYLDNTAQNGSQIVQTLIKQLRMANTVDPDQNAETDEQRMVLSVDPDQSENFK